MNLLEILWQKLLLTKTRDYYQFRMGVPVMIFLPIPACQCIRKLTKQERFFKGRIKFFSCALLYQANTILPAMKYEKRCSRRPPCSWSWVLEGFPFFGRLCHLRKNVHGHGPCRVCPWDLLQARHGHVRLACPFRPCPGPHRPHPWEKLKTNL